MTALLITVEIPETGQTTYRFEKGRVRVGRHQACDLSICHQVMPRELCVAWVEDDSHTVRVEERPRLTNPLIKGKTIVAGGVSGKRMVLSVGSIRLRFEAGEGTAPAVSRKKGPVTKPLLFAAPGAIILGLAVIFLGGTNGDASRASGFSTLPDNPFCPVEEDPCDAPESCMERARLLITRAGDLRSRPGGRLEYQVRAATFLRRAAYLCHAAKSPRFPLVEQEASRMEDAIGKAYRRDVMLLRGTVREGGKIAKMGEAAARVVAYLGPCHMRGATWLRSLQTNHPPRLEEP